ncbi:MAG TPA: pirin family protein [Steroidobacteraceae bacterium]|nr:pirin family protein [Steroidobacteraceae bacterium]
MSAIELVIDARRRDLGGFEVGRVLPWTKRRMVGPFIFFDHIGPAMFPPSLPQRTDVRPHPHIGLSTITYLFAGEIVHRDSVGCYQVIRPGEVNWMTAGRGISHSERFETMREHGGEIHGIQAWVALPEAHEETDPAFVHFSAESLPIHKLPGATIKLIAGAVFGEVSPVQTHSALFYAHVELEGDATIEVPNDVSERAVFVAAGRAVIDSSTTDAGQMVVLTPGAQARVRAIGTTTLMLLGGEPVGPRHIYWNFVSSRPERIEQAKADWRAMRIPLPVDDDNEFIPLPDDPPAPPEPMS